MISIRRSLQIVAGTATPVQSEVEATVVEITVSMKSEAPVPVPGNRGSRTRLTIADGKARFDQIEGSSPQILSASPTAYSLSSRNGFDLYTIDTAKKEYSRVDLAQMKEMMSDAMSMLGQVNMKMSSSRFDVDSLGAGEAVLGYPTVRWRSVQSMTVSMAVGADSIAMAMENTTESLYAPSIEALKAGTLPEQDSIMKLGMFDGLVTDELMKTMAVAYQKLPKGIPIRSVATTSMMMGMEEFTVTTTTEVSKIEKVKRPASFFELPKGYKEVEMDLSGVGKPSQ